MLNNAFGGKRGASGQLSFAETTWGSPGGPGGVQGGSDPPGWVREDIFLLFYADSKKHIFDKIRQLFPLFDSKFSRDHPDPPLAPPPGLPLFYWPPQAKLVVRPLDGWGPL